MTTNSNKPSSAAKALRILLLTSAATPLVLALSLKGYAQDRIANDRATNGRIVVAQGLDADQKKKGAPPAAAPARPAPPPAAAPPPPRPAPPPAAAPPPPPRPAAPPPPPPPRAAPPPPPPPRAAPPPPPPAPPKAAPPPPPAPPKAAPPPAPPKAAPPPPPQMQKGPPPAMQKGPDQKGPAPSVAPAPSAPPPAPQTQQPKGPAPQDRSAPPGAGVPPPVIAPRPQPGLTPPPAPPPGAGPAPTPAPGATPPAPTPTPGATPAPTPPPSGGRPPVTQLPDSARRPPPPPQVNAPLPPPPPVATTPVQPGGREAGRRRLEDFRGQRREEQIGGRTIITEPGRVIVRDPGGQSYVRHNEVDRFRIGARDFRTERRGNDTRTIVLRPDGSQIITVTDRDGRFLRRIRRDARGREIIIIDNSFRPRRGGGIGGFFVALPPPVIRIPQERYIVEYEDAPPELVYQTLLAPPVERIERRYTLDEIRYSPSVRDRMPRVDLDTVNFETGSWELSPDQVQKLQVIADGINQAVQRNPREVFLIEGHTDAVGSDEDNLSLSDRRAEAVAAALTEQFQVPPENLTSQGYGEQYLKVQTDGPERANRRVAVRRITPLLTGQNTTVGPPPPGTLPQR